MVRNDLGGTAMQTVNNGADKLNGLLKGEISAVETYSQAIGKVTNPGMIAQLEDCQNSHAQRVDFLAREIEGMGGDPASDSGAWGAFAKFVEGSAAVFGEMATIAMLEEGEDKGLEDYRKLLEEPDESIHQTVRRLLPMQEQTHQALSDMKHMMH
jgi:Domain of unknown function (DUF2383)